MGKFYRTENRDKLDGNKDTKVKSLLNDLRDIRWYLIDTLVQRVDNLGHELSVCKRDSEMLRKVVKIVNSEKMPYQAMLNKKEE